MPLVYGLGDRTQAAFHLFAMEGILRANRLGDRASWLSGFGKPALPVLEDLLLRDVLT